MIGNSSLPSFHSLVRSVPVPEVSALPSPAARGVEVSTRVLAAVEEVDSVAVEVVDSAVAVDVVVAAEVDPSSRPASPVIPSSPFRFLLQSGLR